MPRAKSAAKRAKEAIEEKNKEAETENQQSKADEGSPNEDFSSESSDSESEDEDEYGELLDEETDNQINNILQALKSNDNSILDKEKKFFDPPEVAVSKLQKGAKQNKPMYLHDYHRKNLLENGGIIDENEEEEIDVKTYQEVQDQNRTDVLSEIKNAFQGEEDEDDEEDEFFSKKKKSAPSQEVSLPDPNEDQEKFLEAYVNSQAWIPKNKDELETLDLGYTDKKDIKAEEAFDEAVEKFENVYNFRYEDAASAEIISYARNQATMRRSNMNSRKKQRLKKQEKAKEQKRKHEEKLKKKKQEKVNIIMDRLEEIKKAVGEDVDSELITKVFGDSLLKDDFDDEEWDSKMNQIFDEKFYAGEGKPTWEDDDEIMNEFYDEKKRKAEKEGEEKEEKEEVDDETEKEDEEEEEEDKEDVKQEEDSRPKKKSKKEILSEKKKAKKSKEALRKQAHQLVDTNIMAIEDEVAEEEDKEREKNGEKDIKFKYIEVEPETFGLTQKEILFADDKSLSEFISIKKLAPWRDPQAVAKDKRKVSKKRRLREWRKQVFNDENGLQ